MISTRILHEAASRIEVKESMAVQPILNYSTLTFNGLSVIAIGGDKLSRGTSHWKDFGELLSGELPRMYDT